MAHKKVSGLTHVRASVQLRSQTIGQRSLFAMPIGIGGGDACAGQPDGTPCGANCECRSGEPWYTPEEMAARGFQIHHE
jgi:hypothetical protein